MTREEKAAYDREYYRRNRERIKARARRWYSENKERALERVREWALRNPEKSRRYKRSYKERNPDLGHANYVRRMHGVTASEEERMSSAQEHRCAICRDHRSATPHNRLSLDHCHDTGEVRGLLCIRCNTGLGMFRDDPELLLTAMAYLEATDSGKTHVPEDESHEPDDMGACDSRQLAMWWGGK